MTGGLAPQPIWNRIAGTLADEIARGHYRPGDRAADRGRACRPVRREPPHGAPRPGGAGRGGAGPFPPRGGGVRRGAAHRISAGPPGAVPPEPPRGGAPPGARGARHRNPLCRRRGGRGAGPCARRGGACVEGLSLADGQPIAAFRSVFPGRALPRPARVLLERALHHRRPCPRGRAGLHPRLDPADGGPATATQALHLRLREGAPLLRSVAVNVDAGGTARRIRPHLVRGRPGDADRRHRLTRHEYRHAPRLESTRKGPSPCRSCLRSG